MDGRALTRLRIAFVLLAAALLLPLALLLRSVDSRLEAQRRLRHELVAERIFDEMEGELTALLAREDARPSDAYAGDSTRVENWAPFVVGYFTRDARGVQILAKPQLAPERVHRLEATLKPAEAPPGGSAPPPPAAPAEASRAFEHAAEGRGQPVAPKAKREAKSGVADQFEAAPAPARNQALESAKGIGAAAPSATDGAHRVKPLPEAIIKQLNRAADVREREQAPSKRKALSRDDNDPLSGKE